MTERDAHSSRRELRRHTDNTARTTSEGSRDFTLWSYAPPTRRTCAQGCSARLAAEPAHTERPPQHHERHGDRHSPPRHRRVVAAHEELARALHDVLDRDDVAD